MLLEQWVWYQQYQHLATSQACNLTPCDSAAEVSRAMRRWRCWYLITVYLHQSVHMWAGKDFYSFIVANPMLRLPLHVAFKWVMGTQYH